ncbi:hypothetical protein ABFX02_12G050900 [Erythranthe guttata]
MFGTLLENCSLATFSIYNSFNFYFSLYHFPYFPEVLCRHCSFHPTSTTHPLAFILCRLSPPIVGKSIKMQRSQKFPIFAPPLVGFQSPTTHCRGGATHVVFN